VKSAADLGIPERFNATTYFVDRHLGEGRGGKIAVECGDERVSYGQLAERVNRCGNALRNAYGVGPGDRVVLLLHDGPAFFYAFYGAIKIGAVPVPINTLWKTGDYRFVLRDSGARVLIASEALQPLVEAIARDDVPDLRHVLIVDRAGSLTDFSRVERLRSSRQALGTTSQLSGCTPPAARAPQKAACICSTTWSSARSCTRKRS